MGVVVPNVRVFLICLLPSLYPPFLFLFKLFACLFVFFFSLLSQCDRSPNVPVQGHMAGLQGLLAIRAFYCLGAD